jgi:hypothetical protein
MRGHESFAWSNISATPAQFSLLGGTYVLDAVATWSTGSVKLQRVGPDGSTLIDPATAASLTANGTSGALSLPPGKYQLTIATATAVYASLTRIPGE